MKLTKKAQSAQAAADLLRRSRTASRAGNEQQASLLRGQAYKKLGYQPNPRAKGKAAVKNAVITTIKKADNPKEAIKDAKGEEKELREAAKSKKAEAKEAEANLKKANKEAKAEPTAEKLEAKADAEAKVEAIKTEAEVLEKSADAIKEGIAEAAPATKTKEASTKKPAASTTKKAKETKTMAQDISTQARGHFGAFMKAKKAGDLEGQADQRAKLKKIGYNVRGEELIPFVNSAPAAKKPAAKKTAAAAKKPAAKKPAAKKAGAKKPAAKKAAAKAAPAKKTAAAGGKARGGSRKGPAFPAAAKGAKVLAKQATTVSKQNGRTITKTVTRTFRENPMGDVGTMLTLLVFGVVGAVGGDMLDRYIATMPREGSDKALHGVEAAAAIQQKVNNKRMLAQGGLLAFFGAVTYWLAKKNKKTPSIIFGGIALGIGIRSLLQILNDHAMPAIFKTSGNAAEPSFGDRYYSGEQEAAQADLSGILASYDATIKAQTGKTSAEVAEGSKLAGLSARVGGPMRPTTQTSDRRAPAALPAPARTAPAALPAPTSAVAKENFAPASRVAAEVHAEKAPAGKLGCGGPSCGPSCGCNACKAAWGGGGGLTDIFGGRPVQTPGGGATPIPLPANERIEPTYQQLGANVRPIRSPFQPAIVQQKRYPTLPQFAGMRG